MNRVVQNVVLWDWLYPAFHFAGLSSMIFMAELYSIVCIHRILFIHYLIFGLLSSVAMDMHVQL